MNVDFEDALNEQAIRLGMDPSRDRDFLWLAEESLRAPLPAGWEMANDERCGLPYFFNESTGETQWDHPSDEVYRRRFERLKAEASSGRRRDERLHGTHRSSRRNAEDEDEDMHGSRRRGSLDADVAGKHAWSSLPSSRADVGRTKSQASQATDTKVADLESSLRSAKADAHALRSEMGGVEAQLAARQAEVDDLKASAEMVRIELEAKGNAMSAELEGLRLGKAESERKLEALEASSTQCNGQLKAAEAEALRCRSEVEALRERLSAAAARPDRHSSEGHEAADTAASAALEEARLLSLELDRRGVEVTKERRMAEAEIAKMQARGRNSARELEAKQRQIERLRAEVADAVKKAVVSAADEQQEPSSSVEYAAIRVALDAAQAKIAELTRARLTAERATADDKYEQQRLLQDAEAARRGFELAARDAESRAHAAHAAKVDAERRVTALEAELAEARRHLVEARRSNELASAPARLEQDKLEREVAEARALLLAKDAELERAKSLFEAEKRSMVAEARAELKRMALEVAESSREDWTKRLEEAVAAAHNKALEGQEGLRDAAAQLDMLRAQLANKDAALAELAEKSRDHAAAAHAAQSDLDRLGLDLQRTRHLLAKEYEEVELRRALDADRLHSNPAALEDLRHSLAAVHDDLRAVSRGLFFGAPSSFPLTPEKATSGKLLRRSPAVISTPIEAVAEHSRAVAIAAASALKRRTGDSDMKRLEPPANLTPGARASSFRSTGKTPSTDLARRALSGPGYRRNLWRQIYGEDDPQDAPFFSSRLGHQHATGLPLNKLPLSPPSIVTNTLDVAGSRQVDLFSPPSESSVPPAYTPAVLAGIS